MNNDDGAAAVAAAIINGVVGLASPPLRRPTMALMIAGAIMVSAMPPDVRPAAHDAFQRVVALLRIVGRRRDGDIVDAAEAEIARAEAEALDAIRACLVQAPNDDDVADFCGVAARAAQRIAAEARA
jgi:hypothetical protein